MPCYSHKQHSGIFLLHPLLTCHRAVNPFSLPFRSHHTIWHQTHSHNFSGSFLSYRIAFSLHVLFSFQYHPSNQPTNHVICCESQSIVWNIWTHRWEKRFPVQVYLFYSSHLPNFFWRGNTWNTFYPTEFSQISLSMLVCRHASQPTLSLFLFLFLFKIYIHIYMIKSTWILMSWVLQKFHLDMCLRHSIFVSIFILFEKLFSPIGVANGE